MQNSFEKNINQLSQEQKELLFLIHLAMEELYVVGEENQSMNHLLTQYSLKETLSVFELYACNVQYDITKSMSNKISMTKFHEILPDYSTYEKKYQYELLGQMYQEACSNTTSTCLQETRRQKDLITQLNDTRMRKKLKKIAASW
ncbi:hypothetical protein [Enterococcus sp. DIV0660C]|uniref:hypothetical protein n=1 Tax=Enterococcus sp. DIV0660C TaxID=2230880 RepID=UPI001A8F4FCF|nr:hypothetical protein [Enterococcus sp. DIV0660C]MBO0432243.1 hypothetical protein [Enterococcus sp. DIV0660C]